MSDANAPKPSILLIACSTLAIAFCISLVSLSLSTFLDETSTFSVASGIILLPIPLVVLICQFGTFFRQNTTTALVSAILLFILSAFVTAILVRAFVDMRHAHILPRGLWFFIVMFFAIVLVTFGTAWLDLRWRRQLKTYKASLPEGPKRRRVSLREVLAGVVIVACTAAHTGYLLQSRQPRYAEHVSCEQVTPGLPVEASDVSYCWGRNGSLAAEFTIDEAAFVKWFDAGTTPLHARTPKPSLEPIATSFTIPCYYSLNDDLMGPEAITLEDGLCYTRIGEFESVYIAFDRQNQRAYYFADRRWCGETKRQWGVQNSDSIPQRSPD